MIPPMIPIARPMLGEEEAEAAKNVILSGWVTQGPKVKEFEDAFARKVGAAHACAVSSCTTALHLALIAVGVEPGDVVITVSHSFIAAANAVRCSGAEPVFVDIEPDSCNMSVEALSALLENDCARRSEGLYYRFIDRIAVGESPLAYFKGAGKGRTGRVGRVAAILPVHQMGFPCDIVRIVDIAREWGLPVVEDAACAVGSDISRDGGGSWDAIGRPHGDVACFSFHPRKVLTTGDGGMLTTNRPGLDATFRLLRQHGMSVSDAARHGSNQVVFEAYLTTAFNYRMTDIQAAIGVEQLKRLDPMIRRRREMAAAYADRLGRLPGVRLPSEPADRRCNWQSYPVRFDDCRAERQKAIMQQLMDRGVATRRGIMNAHQEPAYRPMNWSLPRSESTRDGTILFPFFSDISMEELDYISSQLQAVL